MHLIYYQHQTLYYFLQIKNNLHTFGVLSYDEKNSNYYSQLLYRQAYLRLADLSLDRNGWTTWDELQDYFYWFFYKTLLLRSNKNMFTIW